MRVMDNGLRKKTLLQFGFGTDVMKTVTICTNCHSMESIGEIFCSKCNEKLSGVSLFDYYKSQHKSCSNCKTILSEYMDYCPGCGEKINRGQDTDQRR